MPVLRLPRAMTPSPHWTCPGRVTALPYYVIIFSVSRVSLHVVIPCRCRAALGGWVAWVHTAGVSTRGHPCPAHPTWLRHRALRAGGARDGGWAAWRMYDSYTRNIFNIQKSQRPQRYEKLAGGEPCLFKVSPRFLCFSVPNTISARNKSTHTGWRRRCSARSRSVIRRPSLAAAGSARPPHA